jgi:hypothetical protein
MSTATDPARRLEALRREVWSLTGRRQALEARDAELALAVGLAKGRLAIKPEVDAFLERQQAAAHARTVGSYAKLLTALADDVLHQDIRIGLDLYTERGLPGLDIFAEKDGRRVDLFEGAGGSLTNVVCLGLRTIATVKSGMRSFLALDEPDCWIKPDRVPAFYRVLKQMAGKMRFQALVISHHDVALLGGIDGGINLIAVGGRPEDGLSVTVRAGAPAWADPGEPGIRGIRLRNCAGYADCWLPLSPGMNVLLGDNNIGKSMAVRFLRSAAYGGRESADTDIRHGERRADMEIHIENGLVLHWSREVKRNPVVLWRLLGPDGSVATVDGESCEAGGKDGVPGWVTKVLGIAQRDSLDIQLAHQKRPVFLLGEPPSKRAAVLSIGRESSKIRGMIARHKAGCAEDAQTVRNGEREIACVREQLRALSAVDAVAEDLGAAADAASRQAKASGLAAGAGAAASFLAAARSRLAAAAEADAALAALPGAAPDIGWRMARTSGVLAALARAGRLSDDLVRAKAAVNALEALPPEPPALRPCDAVMLAGRRIRDAGRELVAIRARTAALECLPDGPPSLVRADGADQAASRIAAAGAGLARAMAEGQALAGLAPEPPKLTGDPQIIPTGKRLSDLRKALAEAEQKSATLAAEEQAAAAAIAEALAALGNLCPLCHSHVGHEHLMRAEAVP